MVIEVHSRMIERVVNQPARETDTHTTPRGMQEVNSLYTDSRALRAEYCIVSIPHNTAI